MPKVEEDGAERKEGKKRSFTGRKTGRNAWKWEPSNFLLEDQTTRGEEEEEESKKN